LRFNNRAAEKSVYARFEGTRPENLKNQHKKYFANYFLKVIFFGLTAMRLRAFDSVICSYSESGVARADGIALFSVFIFWALPLYGRRLSGFTGSVF